MNRTVADMSTERIERFWSRVNKTASCWQWTGAVNRSGYGEFNLWKMKFFAHRFAYEYVKGAIPEGLVIDHLCRNPICVNPDHLEAVTQFVNTMRGIGPSKVNSKKTQCKRGHLFDETNTRYIIQKGRTARVCIECDKAKTRAWRARQKKKVDA